MEGHVVGTGVGPLSLQANDLVRLAWDGHRWWIRDWAKGGSTFRPPLPCPVVSALYTQQEPVTTQLNHLKQKCLYTDSIFSSHYR